MHKFSNLDDQQIFELLDKIILAHNTKKEEITNLTRLVDKKIEELMAIEKDYADIIFEVHKRKKENVVR